MNGKSLPVAVQSPARWMFKITSDVKKLDKDQLQLLVDLQFERGVLDATGWRATAKDRVGRELRLKKIKYSEGTIRQ